MRLSAFDVARKSGGAFSPASLFAKYNASGLYIPDFNPARVAASGLGRLYTATGGVTPVTAVADTIGLLLEESRGAALQPTYFTLPPYADKAAAQSAGWTSNGTEAAANIEWTVTGGKIVITRGAGTTAGNPRLPLTGLVNGYAYRFVTSVSGGAGGLACSVFETASPGTGTKTSYQLATATTGNLDLWCASNNQTVTIDALEIVPVAGKHAKQVTAGSRGTLRQVGSRYVWRGDGTDDNLLTTLVPAAAMTMIIAAEWNAVSDTVLGSQGATDGRAFIQTAASTGFLAGGVGTQNASTIVTDVDVRDIPGVAVLRFDGSNVWLGWKPFAGAFSWKYTGAQNGAVNTTVPFRLGANNGNGTAGAFFDGDILAVLAIQAALTDTEIAAVANAFSR